MYKMNPEYYIGIPFIDDQHQTLFGLIDDAQTLLKDENILYKYDDLIKILTGLKDYTIRHFEEETAFMESINYPRLSLHLAAHDGFRSKLAGFEIDAESISLGTQDEMLLHLLDYLMQWLQVHILDCDRKIALFLDGEPIEA